MLWRGGRKKAISYQWIKANLPANYYPPAPTYRDTPQATTRSRADRPPALEIGYVYSEEERGTINYTRTNTASGDECIDMDTLAEFICDHDGDIDDIVEALAERTREEVESNTPSIDDYGEPDYGDETGDSDVTDTTVEVDEYRVRRRLLQFIRDNEAAVQNAVNEYAEEDCDPVSISAIIEATTPRI